MHTKDQQRPSLCWFCGSANGPIACHGNSIGTMVYSSYISVSSEMFAEFNWESSEIPECVSNHAIKDDLQICNVCLSRFASEVGSLSPPYVAAHLARLEDQGSDIADVDTGLKSWKDVVYPFGCWLKSFPDIDVQQKFYGLELSELFDRGLRFSGRATFGEDEFRHFLSRFATGNSFGSPEFYDHLRGDIAVAGVSLPKEIAKIQPVIFDISVFLAINEIRHE